MQAVRTVAQGRKYVTPEIAQMLVESLTSPSSENAHDKLSDRARRSIEDMGIELARVLHGEQSFTYHRMAYAGDVLSFDCHVADIYQKKGGALDFMVRETRVTNQRGEHVADLCGVLVQRNG